MPIVIYAPHILKNPLFWLSHTTCLWCLWWITTDGSTLFLHSTFILPSLQCRRLQIWKHDFLGSLRTRFSRSSEEKQGWGDVSVSSSQAQTSCPVTSAWGRHWGGPHHSSSLTAGYYSWCSLLWIVTTAPLRKRDEQQGGIRPKSEQGPISLRVCSGFVQII